MKKYFYIAIFAGFVASCSNDSVEDVLPQTQNNEETNFSAVQRDSLETGGQGGTTPVKPPKP